MSGKIADASNFKPAGLRAREYAKFRSPRGDEVVVATSVDGVATYPASVNATAKDETAVIAAPGVDKCIRVKTLYVNNAGAAQRLVSFQEGVAGAGKFMNSMPPLGATWNFNLVGAYWILAPNTALMVNLDAIGDVNVEVGYDVVQAISQPALTETVAVSEDSEEVLTEG